MAISKKGTRTITVNDTVFLYKVSKVKRKSGWRDANKELDDTFLRYARYNGLGQIADMTINIVIQLKERPVSSCFVKVHAILVDGFMGPEQLTQIKPNWVAELIAKGLAEGWKPEAKGDVRMDLFETRKGEKPVILQLPDMKQDIDDYENLEKLIELKFQDD